mgnify:CR=1 FL=1
MKTEISTFSLQKMGPEQTEHLHISTSDSVYESQKEREKKQNKTKHKTHPQERSKQNITKQKTHNAIHMTQPNLI